MHDGVCRFEPHVQRLEQRQEPDGKAFDVGHGIDTIIDDTPP